MAHPSANKMFCSPGIFRLILFLVGLCFVGYTMRQQLFRHNSGDASVGSSCPVCHCDCSAETTLPLPLDCGKDNPETNEEMKKDVITLLTEEISLQKTVIDDNLAHTKALIMDARKSSSHYQKEAEKCNTGMETCEEAREKAEAELTEERKLSLLWENRARENGWRDR
ncbi:hypothetical protein DCAR_0103512 [Daucus carota subsp. sativus]|uniref:DUF1068 domain-containing protein n=1 Tax=Daucus carota subsp. sativus TaxID=79200 RepID=A0AAF1AI73_DAUCS|nr:hypothetical protein DCAR_0103512 [Daucus carota subsp. sativus]